MKVKKKRKKNKREKDFYQRLTLSLDFSMGNLNQFITVLCYFPSLVKLITLKNNEQESGLRFIP